MPDVLPFVTFNFRVILEHRLTKGKLCEAAFSECDGLEMSMVAKTIREGGNNSRPIHLAGPVSYGQLTLKRGMTKDFGLWRWFDCTQSERDLRASGQIHILTPEGEPKGDVDVKFNLTNCLPVKIKAPSLSAKDGLIAIEEMQLVYETLALEYELPEGKKTAERAREQTMTTPKKLLKAKLREISWSDSQQVQEQEHEVDVQFNPETLKVSFANQKSGGDQSGGAATQFVGRGTTRLAFDLWFDVTAPEPENRTEKDVRKLTEKVVYFMKPKPGTESNQLVAPGVRFSWGTFLFEGTMDSVNETLEYFSEDGHPLRAQLSVTLSQQEIQFQYGSQTGMGQSADQSPGTRPQETAREGDTLQSKAGDKGRQDSWQNDALRNGIEKPRLPQVGQLLDMRKPTVPFANPSLGVSPLSPNEIRRPVSVSSSTAAPPQLPIER